MKVLSSKDAPTHSGDYGITSVFLAGPTYRLKDKASWRDIALTIFEEFDFEGEIYVPEPFAKNYDQQVYWEAHHLEKASVILFWIPRDLKDLPGFTTNIEFGEWMKSGKVVLGYPQGAAKMRYLAHKAEKYGISVSHTLEATIHKALHKIST